MNELISFTCYVNHRVLVERCPSNCNRIRGEFVFPSGPIHQTDSNHITALHRVLREQTELKPEVYVMLDSFPVGELRMFPFILYDWDGQIPDHNLDSRNQLRWLTLEYMQHSSRIEVATMANLIYALTH